MVLIICLLFIQPLLHPGNFQGHETPAKTAIRVSQLDLNLKSGRIPPRWAPDFAGGLGTPFFNFYHPFFLYICEIFHLAGFSIPLSINIAIAFLTLAAGSGMYLFARSVWGPTAGIAAAAVYIMFPYRIVQLYIRGAYAEFSAGAILPWVFWAGTRYAQAREKRSGAIFALFIFVLVLSHNSIALMSFPVILMWILTGIPGRIIRGRRSRLAAWMGLGVLSASYFWFPALYEMQYTRIQEMKTGYFRISGHFAYLFQLIGDNWGFGPSIVGPDDRLPLQIGVLTCWFCAASAWILWNDPVEGRRRIRFWTTVFTGFLFLNLSVSEPVWNLIPGLSFSQFPWRSMTILAVPASILIGAFTGRVASSESGSSLPGMILILILSAYGIRYINAPSHTDLNGLDFSRTAVRANWETTTASNEYLPLRVRLEHAGYPGWSARVLSGRGTVEKIRERVESVEIEVNAATPVKIGFYRAFYPGWTVKIDGTETPVSSGAEGRIETTVPAGRHAVSVRFRETPLRLAANILSAAGLAVIIFFLLNIRIRPLRNRKDPGFQIQFL
ncbi:hypothetical protein JXA40_11380 [bacterium]|nr:hypothetical protein [candidate division CSSED10-310 bacterium]